MKSRDQDSLNKLRRYREISNHMSTLMDSTDLNLDHFVNTIRFNSELSATIIEIVNRSFSGFAGEIDCLSRAVRMIGMGQLYNIVNSLSGPEEQLYHYYLETANKDSEKHSYSTKLRLAG